jgi:hypothetical protein
MYIHTYILYLMAQAAFLCRCGLHFPGSEALIKWIIKGFYGKSLKPREYGQYIHMYVCTYQYVELF